MDMVLRWCALHHGNSEPSEEEIKCCRLTQYNLPDEVSAATLPLNSCTLMRPQQGRIGQDQLRDRYPEKSNKHNADERA